MTFITGLNATEDQNRLVLNIFGALGKAELVEERLLGPATTLCSCGIAFAFRYIRAAMEGGVEPGPLPAKGSRRRSANPARGDRLARIQRLAPRTGGG